MSTKNTNPSTPPTAISLKQIAELANVTRAAVSNWRNRHEDFPQPLEQLSTSRRPMFALDDVTKWLQAHDYGSQVAKVNDASFAFNTALAALARRANRLEGVALVLSLLAARKRAVDDAFDWDGFSQTPMEGALADAVGLGVSVKAVKRWVLHYEEPVESFIQTGGSTAEISYPQLVSIIADLDLDDAESFAHYCEQTLTKVLSVGGRGKSSWFGYPGSPVTTLLSAAASTTLQSGQTVYDPTAGIGGILTDLSKSADAQALTDVQLYGSDLSETAVSVARLRCYLEGIPATVEHEDPVRFYDVFKEADLIVCEPPFGERIEHEKDGLLVQALKERDLRILQDIESVILFEAFTKLAPGGYAYILSTPHIASDRFTQDLRNRLIAEGCLEAVVLLPKAFLPHTRIAPLLWVLHKPVSKSPKPTFMALNATDVDSPASIIGDVLRAMRSGDPIDLPHREVSLAETITSGGIFIQGLTREAVDYQSLEKDYRDASQSVDAHIEQLHMLRAGLEVAVPQPESWKTLAELISEGKVQRLRGGQSKSEAEDGLVPYYLAKTHFNSAPKLVYGREKDIIQVEAGDVLSFMSFVGTSHVVTEQDLSGTDTQGLPLGIDSGHTILRSQDPSVDPYVLAAAITGTASNYSDEMLRARINDSAILVPMFSPANLEILAKLLRDHEALASQLRQAQNSHHERQKALTQLLSSPPAE